MNKVTVTALMLFAPSTAFAYFDAGTGALIMQGLVGALTFIVVFWGRVKVAIHSLFSRNEDTSSSAVSEMSEASDEQAGEGDVDGEIRR